MAWSTASGMCCSFPPGSCWVGEDFFLASSKNGSWGRCQFWVIKWKLPANELFWDVLPFISLFSVKPEKLVLLVQSPWIFRNDRRKVIVPTLSTLFAWAFGLRVLFGEFIGDLGPVFDAVDWNKNFDCLVFLQLRKALPKKSMTCD